MDAVGGKMAWFRTIVSVFGGFTVLGVTGIPLILALVILWPWRPVRVKLCNIYGKFWGRVAMWMMGCPMTIDHAERLDPHRPAVYVCNHASLADVWIGIQLAPMGTAGIANTGVAKVPFFGQAWLLSGHALVDRGNTSAAVQTMARLVEFLRPNGISTWLYPEGRRSADGRLLPMKKGFYHLAVALGYPVVPVVVAGTHRVFPRGSKIIYGGPVHVKVLEAIDTSDWANRSPDEVASELHDVMAAALPEDQRPLVRA